MRNQGIEYFPLNVDFFDDDKTELIESEFGVYGVFIVVKLLCKIYREGYYYKWGEDECLLFANKAGEGISAQLVDAVVRKMVQRGFFDKDMFEKYHVLTSYDMQKLYFEITKRRKEIEIHEEYLLVSSDIVQSKMKSRCISDNFNENVNISDENADIFQQRKVKESKVKESKEKESEGGGREKKRESPTPAHTDSFSRFMDWMSMNAPWCAEHLTMPTAEQLEDLKRNWKIEDITKTIRNLENNRMAREKYTNLATTIQKWLEQDEKDKRITRIKPSHATQQADTEPRKLTPEEEEARSKAAFRARLERDAANGNEEARRRLEEDPPQPSPLC